MWVTVKLYLCGQTIIIHWLSKKYNNFAIPVRTLHSTSPDLLISLRRWTGTSGSLWSQAHLFWSPLGGNRGKFFFPIPVCAHLEEFNLRQTHDWHFWLCSQYTCNRSKASALCVQIFHSYLSCRWGVMLSPWVEGRKENCGETISVHLWGL